MSSKELRERFLSFFESRGHKVVSSNSLIPADPSVLFTTAGMQQFKPYYLGEKSPYGINIATSQKCFRTSDIEEVGDESHLTFLEMLGNFSFSGYFKKEAIKLAYDFLFKELKIPLDEAIFTVFEGDPSANSGQDVPEDKESIEIWKKLGIPEDRIKKCPRKDNFWGPTGDEGPCGPTTEIHIRGIEIWNLVFNEYYQDRSKKLTPLAQKGVDTGMGLERLAMIVQERPSVFETDLFEPIIKELGVRNHKPGGKESAEKAVRIIADHVKSAVFLISEDIFPSNVERGYILRRILRRAIRYGRLLNLSKNFLIPSAQKVIEIYKNVYPEVKSKEAGVLIVIQQEEEKFEKTLEQGLREFEKIAAAFKKIQLSGKNSWIYFKDGEKLFYLLETYGFPLELSLEELKNQGINILENQLQDEFDKAFKKHQEISRAGVEVKFGGVGKDAGYEIAKLHTVTHLLHAALRKILGEHVKQMGSDITVQRIRFDFSHPQKMEAEEVKKVEELVNRKIKEDLEVKKEEISYQEAIKGGALAFFKEKYPPVVTVFSIGNFSKEICAGPHVKRTSELGQFKIIKEESSGAGVRRIRAILQ